MAIYLLHGDSKSTDSYGVRNRLEQLLKDIDTEANMNFATYDMSVGEANFQEVITSALTVPFLGGQRIVVAKGVKSVEKAFKSKDDEEESKSKSQSATADAVLRAVEQLEQLPDDALLILVEETGHLDGRTSFYKALKKLGCKVETFKAMWFDPAAGNVRDAIDFIQSESTRRGLRLDYRPAERFAHMVGSDKAHIIQEIEKLALYAGEGSSPTEEDVENVVTKSHEAGIFELVDLIGYGKVKKAIDALGDLLDHGAAPPYILTMIARQMRLIGQTREALANGVQPSEGPMAKALKQSPFVTRKLLIQAESFPKFSYPKILEMLMDTDLHLKRSTMDTKLALETLIARLAGVSRH